MYTYYDLCIQIENLPQKSIGESLLGRRIFMIKEGSGEKKLFLNGAHHGIEYITAKICMDFYFYIKGKVKNWSIFIVPMVNPDGVMIAQGLEKSTLGNYCGAHCVSGIDFYKKWKANARGVDLNHNYNADFKKLEKPGPQKCSGEYPESEPESRAIANLVRKENFDMVFCLHSQGEVIYHGFKDFYPEGSRCIAEEIRKVSGYAIEREEGTAGFGGMKDWFVEKYKRPGFTLEVGRGENPICENQIEEIEKKIFPAIERAMLTYEEVLC